MTSRHTDDLYTRYMKAREALVEHASGCEDCVPDRPCAVAKPLQERLARLQDVHLQRLKGR